MFRRRISIRLVYFLKNMGREEVEIEEKRRKNRVIIKRRIDLRKMFRKSNLRVKIYKSFFLVSKYCTIFV